MKSWLDFLFSVAFGPRTDVQNMNRAQLFRSAASFLIWTLFMIIIMVAFALARRSLPNLSPTLEGVFIFVLTFSFGIGLIASLYLFVRGIFRSADFIPGGGAVDTGYFVDDLKRIVNADGPIGVYLDDEDQLNRNGEYIGIYIEDGRFYQSESRIGKNFAVFAETGHFLNSEKKIFAKAAQKLPWEK